MSKVFFYRDNKIILHLTQLQKLKAFGVSSFMW